MTTNPDVMLADPWDHYKPPWTEPCLDLSHPYECKLECDPRKSREILGRLTKDEASYLFKRLESSMDKLIAIAGYATRTGRYQDSRRYQAAHSDSCDLLEMLCDVHFMAPRAAVEAVREIRTA